MSISELYTLFLQHPLVQTDSRKLQKGDIFFALKGDNFNGNQFAVKALEDGASYAVVDEDISGSNSRLIRVDDVLTTLQLLAKHHREQFNIPFIAITGSNGKTTTKELVHAVLSTSYRTYTTKGNLNNHIGVPLTILAIKADAQMAVIEMGANHQKEIAGYCVYAQPTHGLITNCGKAHLEGFGGVEGVRKGKGELYDYLRQNGGMAFAFDDYDYLHQMVEGIKEVVWYGTKQGLVTGDVLKTSTYLELSIERGLSFQELATRLVGAYNLPNVLSALAIGKYFNVQDEKLKQAIENYTPSNSRSQLLKWKGNDVILDAYNANPTSMRAAIENFASMKSDAKFLLLGAMMELGEESLAEHQSIIDLIKQFQWKGVLLVGGDFEKVQHPFKQFHDAKEAGQWLKKQNITNAQLLVKGSRSMKMETTLDEVE